MDAHPATAMMSAADSSKLPPPSQVTDFAAEESSNAGDTLIMNPRPPQPESPTTVVAKTPEPAPTEKATRVQSSAVDDGTAEFEAVPDTPDDDDDETDVSSGVHGGGDGDTDDLVPSGDAKSTLIPEMTPSAELEDPVIAEIEGGTRRRKRKTATRHKNK
jgi:hypothetical protein